MVSFSCKTKFAHFITWCKCLHFFDDLPCDIEVDVFVVFLNFHICSPSVVEVLLCSNLKYDLCKFNLVLNSFSVSPIYVSWLFEAVSVTFALYTTHLVRHLPSSGQESFLPTVT